VKSQERNTAQLERIEAMVKQKWGSKKGLWSHKKESEVEEDGDNKEGSKDGPRESQKKRTPLSAFY